jgi:hypothetical protein
MMKKLVLCFMLVMLMVVPACSGGAGVCINEFSAYNDGHVADADGDYGDWLELYNGGSRTIRLEGYYLSDDESEPLKWRFPQVELAPGEYLLVWASGKNRVQGELHTNFSIKQEGEPLILSSPKGNVVDWIEPVPGRPEASVGRIPDGGRELHYLFTPSPGRSNSVSDSREYILSIGAGAGTYLWLLAIVVVVFIPLFIWFWRKTRR